MSKRGENIYKRKDGRWEGRYKKGRKENGQLKYGYVYGSSYTELKERLYKYKLKYQTLIHLYGESSITFENWCFYWLDKRKSVLKSSTYSTYHYKLKQYIFPNIGQLALNEITQEEIQKMVNRWIEEGLEATTIHVLYQITKKSLVDALNQQKTAHMPCYNIDLPRKKKNQIGALSKKDQAIIEDNAKKVPLHKGLPILLALHAGLRIGEIAALKWEDIDFDRRSIYIHQTYQRLPIGAGGTKTILSFDFSKTNQSIRLIPMSRTLVKYLKKWRRQSNGSFVCSNTRMPSEPRLLTYHFHQVRKISGMESIHFHQLRHTFATRCVEANGDIASISRLLGHKSTKTTLDIYTDSFFEQREDIIKSMEKKKKK